MMNSSSCKPLQTDKANCGNDFTQASTWYKEVSTTTTSTMSSTTSTSSTTSSTSTTTKPSSASALQATPQCPWTYGCLDDSNTCIRCDESPWYQTDGKCTCGPTADDWHTSSDCRKCGNAADLEVTNAAKPSIASALQATPQCPWTYGCLDDSN